MMAFLVAREYLGPRISWGQRDSTGARVLAWQMADSVLISGTADTTVPDTTGCDLDGP